MRKISIIIVTYNSISIIKDCIDSIFKFNDIGIENIEIIVVDNSCEKINNTFFKYLRELYDDKIIFIKNDLNLGYGQGNNIGIEKATGSIVCIMNPDVRFTQPLLNIVLKEFDLNFKLCSLGFKQIGGVNLSFYLKPEYYLSFLSSLVVKFANRFSIFNQNYFCLSGAFLFVDKRKFEQIGKFDENIFLYHEEPDISNRILKKNYSIKFNKNQKYSHLVGERSSYSHSSFIFWLESLTYYLNKFGIDQKMYFHKMCFDLRFYLLVSIILGNKKKVEKIKKQITGIKEYLANKN